MAFLFSVKKLNRVLNSSVFPVVKMRDGIFNKLSKKQAERILTGTYYSFKTKLGLKQRVSTGSDVLLVVREGEQE